MELFADDEDVSVHLLGGIWSGRSGIERLYLQHLPQRLAGHRPPHGIKIDDPEYECRITFSDDESKAFAYFACSQDGCSELRIS